MHTALVDCLRCRVKQCQPLRRVLPKALHRVASSIPSERAPAPGPCGAAEAAPQLPRVLPPPCRCISLGTAACGASGRPLPLSGIAKRGGYRRIPSCPHWPATALAPRSSPPPVGQASRRTSRRGTRSSSPPRSWLAAAALRRSGSPARLADVQGAARGGRLRCAGEHGTGLIRGPPAPPTQAPRALFRAPAVRREASRSSSRRAGLPRLSTAPRHPVRTTTCDWCCPSGLRTAPTREWGLAP